MPNKSYHEQFKIDTTVKLREKLKLLPGFASLYFRGIEPTTSVRTRIAYAYDLNIFFQYLNNETDICDEKDVTKWDISVLDKVTPTVIQDCLDYLKFYSSSDNTERSNSERGISRKLSSVRSFYNYFYRMEMIKNNPASIVRMPKLHQKEIIRLDSDEVGDLLDHVETGKDLTKHQQSFHEKTKVRDLALLTLLLGTGIRVSECVGLDLKDVDFKNHGISIVRKGGNQVVVYFGNEVEVALADYMRERYTIVPVEGHENALFLSMQRKRMSVRSVELLVKKYSGLVTQLKRITPHKLRSTYGTALYKETGDIYLVADVLGHSDVNTTKKHYAAIEDSRRRMARNIVTLRENPSTPADELSKEEFDINKNKVSDYKVSDQIISDIPENTASEDSQVKTDTNTTVKETTEQNTKNNIVSEKNHVKTSQVKIDLFDLDLDDI